MRPSGASQEICDTLLRLCDRGVPFALALALHTEGHSPCKAGASALIEADGTIHGTIGGGEVEAETQRRAVVAIRQMRAEVFEFRLEGDSGESTSPICGGTMRILVDPAAAARRETYAAVRAALVRREQGVLETTIAHTVPLQITARFRQDPAAPTPSPEPREVFQQPVVPKPLLVIVGGGHVARALAVQAALVGFQILVVEDRPEFARRESFPVDTLVRCGPIAQELAAVPFGADTYAVIVTRGHRTDAAALAVCVRKPRAYLGMIGSRRKVALLRQEFIAGGTTTPAEFDRIHAPIGLDLGAETVPEIAASIVAELISVRRRGAP